MRHKIGFKRLGRKKAHRVSMIRNMVASLIDSERITTTKAKAKEVRRKAEKMITRAKVDSVHNRRIAARDIMRKNTLAKLFNEVGPRFEDRAGGYTRILKLGNRNNDAAEMVILELVEKTDSNVEKKQARIKQKEVKEQKEAEEAQKTKEAAQADEAENADTANVETEEKAAAVTTEKSENDDASVEAKDEKE